jgi:lysophospholipase L1-like esterase
LGTVTFVVEGRNAVVDAAYAPIMPVAQAQRFLSKLSRGVENTVALQIGDSTGNELWEHVYLEFSALAARFPAVTFIYLLVDPTTGVYGSPVTVQTGTGSATCTLYNASVSGSRPGWVLGSRWSTAVASVPSPDLILVSHGHNLADPTTPNGRQAVRGQYLALTEGLAKEFPTSGLVLEAQNPSARAGRETWQAIKASIVEEIAAQRGYGFIDVHQAFLDYQAANGLSITDLQLDDGTFTHPNAEGSQVWADAVGKALTYRPENSDRPQAASSLLTVAESLIPDPRSRTGRVRHRRGGQPPTPPSAKIRPTF